MKNTKENVRGITLIALVITIIILLILAGITISSLMGNGLFEKTKLAREKHEIAQIKEEIEMSIMEIQVEETSKENNVTVETLANGQLKSKLKEIIVELSNNKITGQYKDYDYTIDENLKVEIGKKVTGEKPKIEYELSTEEIGATEVTITVKASVSDGVIEKIIRPDGEEESKSEITYKVNKSGSYVFVAVSSTGRKESCTVKVMNITPTTPVISVIQLGGYPTFTDSEVISVGSIIEIEYDNDEIIKNYYSEDDGEWKPYTGKLTTSATKIMAKSVIESETGIESQIANRTLELPKDALGSEAYDDDPDNYTKKGSYMSKDDLVSENGYRYKFYVDNSCWDKYMSASFRTHRIYKRI